MTSPKSTGSAANGSATTRSVKDLFVSDVTRDIPPVVYFHEQSPEKLAEEVSEYIITGGWPEGHPNHRRVPSGIHEQYVELMRAIAAELDRKGGPDLPAVWISGFYGSGKSSFAKLFGLAVDGVALPSGSSLAEAWLKRDTSPKAQELRDAWKLLRQKIEPLAVVFDIGGTARDNEHIHSAAVRQLQRRLGYCSTEPLVADFELRLERDGEWGRFIKTAEEVLGEPWSEVKDRQLAEDDFSHVLSVMYPERYVDPTSWIMSRGGTHARSESPEEAVAAIGDMLAHRRPGATLFLVVDEVSQYVHTSKDRIDRLRAFASALGSGLKGKAWLVALGQQKIDEQADDSFLVWAKDRFPAKLRVHLAATNIRDVVHKRLLQKKPEVEAELRELFERNRAALKLYAHGCEDVTPDEFVDVYPMLPGQIELILELTTALRTRSSRAQGDDQAIRGLLQLLGELFRDQKLADEPVGALVSLDRIYEVQHTALDSDVQASMARILGQCTGDEDSLLVRAAKAVALLELIQETRPTDARLVAQCLYDRVDLGNQVPAVTEALEELRRRNLLGYTEKHGYKIQSSAGEEWDRERRDIGVGREALSEVIQDALKWLLAQPERPRLQGRPFPWAGLFSDGRRASDVSLVDPREDACVRVDLRYLTSQDERIESGWVKRSAESALENRLVWVCGDCDQLDGIARDLHRSRAMVKKYKPRRESLQPARRMLLQQEENRIEDLDKRVREAVAATWMSGKMYFRGLPIAPKEQGAGFAAAAGTVGSRILPEIFPRFVATQVQPTELMLLLDKDLSGPPSKFLQDELGILDLDGGRYVPVCTGVVPSRIVEHIEAEDGLAGATLLAHFGAAPYGYTTNVVKACVAGLLRASKIKVQTEAGVEITSIGDADVRELFDKDRFFRRSTLFPAGEDDIGFTARARICKFFDERLGHVMDREDHAIADAVATHFPELAGRLRGVQGLLAKVRDVEEPKVFAKLADVLEQCVRACRQTKPTVKLVKKHLDVLRDGVQRLQLYEAELTDEAIRAVATAHNVLEFQSAQLREIGVVASNVEAADESIRNHLKTERPWVEICAVEELLEEIRRAYLAEREVILRWQEQEADAARARLKGREGFSTLTADQSHKVLRPLTEATTDTTIEAVAPGLADLKDPFELALRRAEDLANDILDKILAEGDEPIVARVCLNLRSRELSTEDDVKALLEEIRSRLMEHIRAGRRVRLQ